MNIPTKDKLRSHLPERDMKFIDAEVRILLKQRMGYGKIDLHGTPHRSELTSNKDNADLKLKMHNIGHSMIAHGGNSGIIDIVDQWGLFVMYENHPLFAGVSDLDGDGDSILHWDKTRTKDTSGFFNNRI